MKQPESIVEDEIDSRVAEVESAMDGDVVTLCAPIIYGIDDMFRNEIEAINPKRTSKRLVVFLETTGGYIEVAQRMADTMRHHYDIVEFIVPSYAMSAGTVLVMSGDAIHMDYYSILGPIDPQVPKSGYPHSQLIPALGYLKKYDQLIQKSADNVITSAEVAYLIAKFDPAEMYQIEQARELSITLLKEWLVKYKFKDWNTTETRGIPVTAIMKKARAKKIATELNKTERWHTHGRGISMEVLRRQLNVKIEDFEAATYGAKVKEYYQLLKSYMMRRDWDGVFHRRTRFAPLSYGVTS